MDSRARRTIKAATADWRSDRHRSSQVSDPWAIYALVAESGEGEFTVKIGVSTCPYRRYDNLATGVPFRSVMLWAFAGTKQSAFQIESALHAAFAQRNTAREWFRFKLEDSQEFHSTFKRIYFERLGRQLEWTKITEPQLAAFRNYNIAKRGPQKAAPRKKRMRREFPA
jgi:hypothetical protein